jgi:ferredoxin
MKNVLLQPLDERVIIKTNARVLDVLLAKDLDVLMACGGHGLCATCHVWVDEGMTQLTPMTEREQRTLGWVTGANPRSRLACQAKVLGEGVVVSVPEGMYIESTQNLERLIGQRASLNILHPGDGKTLIPKGKIITRSRIMELASVDFDMAQIRARVAKMR